MTLTGSIVTDNLDTLLVTFTELQIPDDFRNNRLNELIRIDKRFDDVFTIIVAAQFIKLDYVRNRFELEYVAIFHKMM